MWIVKWVLGAAIVLLIILFAAQNSEQLVSVKFFKWQSVNLQLWVVMYAAFAVGVIVWLFVTMFQILGLKGQVRRARKEAERLQDELDGLRNISIEDESHTNLGQ